MLFVTERDDCAIKMRSHFLAMAEGSLVGLPDEVFDRLCSMLPPRAWLALRCVNRFFRKRFPVSALFSRVKLPLLDGLTQEQVFSRFLWFFALPEPDVPIESFPTARVRGAVARLYQGGLRSLSVQRTQNGTFLMGKAQPSVSWSQSSYEVFLRFGRFLSFERCSCRNG